MAMAIKLRIAHKIGAIAGSGIAGLLIIAVIYFNGSARQDQFSSAAASAQAISRTANSLNVGLLESRRAEKEFVLYSDVKYVEQHAGLAQGVNRDLNAIRTWVGEVGHADLGARLTQLQAGFNHYSEDFARIVQAKKTLGLTENEGLEGKLRKSIHEIEQLLNTFDEPSLLVQMLMMRRQEKDFMLRRDPRYGVNMKTAAAAFLTELRKTSLSAETKAEIGQKLKVYQADFVAWMEGALVLTQAQKEAADAFAAIEPVIRDNLNAVERIFVSATEASEQVSATTKLVMQVAMLLTVIAVSALGFLIGRAVSQPLAAMTKAMRELARGNFSVELPGLGRSDEIGDMANAVQVFKESGLRVQALEQQERAAAAERAARTEKMVAVVSDVGQVVAAAAAGDFSARLKIDNADGDMQKLVGGINEINSVVDRATTEFADVLTSVAQGDLTRMVGSAYQGRFGELKQAVNDTVMRLSETIAGIQATTAEVATAAREIKTGSDDLARRTEEQAAALEETAATTEELAASVKASAGSSRVATEAADEASGVARRGGTIVQDAVAAMEKIEAASRKITDITDVIDGIAFQTNLLALNAAVEAARAGDAGKGFAVVASEVRTLAQRSGEASKDINALLVASSLEVAQGVALVRSAGEMLGEIVSAAQRVAGTVSDISSAAAEQAHGIDDMSQTVAHLDGMTQQNAALAEESAASAAMLTGQVEHLDRLVATFKTRRDGRAGRAFVAPQSASSDGRSLRLAGAR